MTSVKARSNPLVACGPVFIDTQKQVPAGCPQFTATMKIFLRLAAYTGSTNAPPMKTLSWVAIACNSHARTPRKANFETLSFGLTISKSDPRRVAYQRRVTGGNRNFFQECGPTA